MRRLIPPGQAVQCGVMDERAEPENERALVAAMLAGDERAFTRFFDGYFPRVYRFALPRVDRNETLAREVVQATLVKALRRIDSWRGEAALFTWLCQICRNEITDQLRSERRRRAVVVPIDDDEELRAVLEAVESPPAADPLRNASAEEVRQLVHTVLDRLPGRYGEALEWKYVEGHSVEEIGQKLGIGTTAAQSLLARARIAFREGLESVFGASAGDVLAGLDVP